MEIKIYAPVDCEVKSLEKCTDPTFSQKMLGDGLLILPKKNKFYSPFVEAKTVMIFETKHAYGFDIDDTNVLIHCGLDTVKLGGKPFKTKLELDKKVRLGDELFEVDLKMVEAEKISNETPIVFDKKIEIINFKEGNYKQGELICTIKIIEEVLEKVNPNSMNEKDFEEFFYAENKYQKEARMLNEFVGGPSNYRDVYNCMTRLRFLVKNKDLVNEEKIRRLSLVKSTIWQGDELQVVIGQDVYKLKDEVIAQNEFAKSVAVAENSENKEKQSKGAQFIRMFASIMVKTIPIIVGCAIVQAIVGILVQINVMPDIVITAQASGNQVLLKDAAIGWIILFIMAKTTTVFGTIAIAISTAQYFKFDVILAASIALILSTPLMFLDGGSGGMGHEWILINFGDLDTGNPVLDGISKVKIAAMTNKMFVVMGAIIAAKYLNDWIKTWIPISLELMFRPFILVMVIVPTSFFILLPIWNVIETLAGTLMYWIGQAPLGIGVGFYIGIWQVAVIFGIHMGLIIVGILDNIQRGGAGIFMIMGISVWAQVGALIGVILVTQNSKLKKDAIHMLPAGCLGITEPILYGINLPKKRPLIAGCIAAFIAGAYCNAVGVTARAGTGFGVFEFIGFFSSPTMGGTADLSNITNGILYITGAALALGLGTIFSLLIYIERPNEKSAVSKSANALLKFIKVKNDLSEEEIQILKTQVKEMKQVIDKETIKQIKLIEKQIQKVISVDSKIETLIENEYKHEQRIYKKGKKALSKNNLSIAKKLVNEFNNLTYKERVEKLKDQRNDLKALIDFKTLDNIIGTKEKEIEEMLNEFNKEYNLKSEIKEIRNEYWNDLNSLKIAYDYEKPKELKISLKVLTKNLAKAKKEVKQK
ncbi:PTS glucose transporter subunit IIABC [Mesoplasma coleopterae]|uniref:PTS system, beta-glucoside-specific IIABC component n=1 Tax=Mesoplasma coleopterae TaxID=324078 RepID=A0A2K8P5Y4_9MOLU|nr:PTS glucose transporter subunit IIABC [Mesoplasma coleopterae]ATZ21153.1 PTS system, beta-glucoside-specific IIABC component [Mesoplasma coleopterae]